MPHGNPSFPWLDLFSALACPLVGLVMVAWSGTVLVQWAWNRTKRK